MNPEVFRATVDHFMETTSSTIKTCFRLSTKTAYKYEGKMTKDELVAAFEAAVKATRDTITKNK